MKSEEKNSESMMKLIYPKTIEKERVKIGKVEDYYEFFVRMLNVEEEELHTHENF